MTLALALHIAAHVHPSSSSAAFFEPTDRPSRTSSSRRRRGREEKSLSPTLSRLHLVARRRASNFVHSSSRKSINHRNQAIRRHYSLFCNTTSDASLFVSSSSPRRPLSARFSTLVASTNPSSLALDRPRTTSSAMPSVVTLVSASSFVSRARWARRASSSRIAAGGADSRDDAMRFRDDGGRRRGGGGRGRGRRAPYDAHRDADERRRAREAAERAAERSGGFRIVERADGTRLRRRWVVNSAKRCKLPRASP